MMKNIEIAIKMGGVDHVSGGYILSCIKRLLHGLADVKFSYNIENKCVKIKCYGYCEDRECKTAEMMITAFEKIHYDLKTSFNMNVCCHDLCRQKLLPIYSYCKRDNQRNVKLIPDFWYINWKEYGISDYEIVAKEIYEASKETPIYNQLFWIGSVREENPVRKKLYEIGEKDDRLKIVASNLPVNNQKIERVTLPDHAKYKYLLDVDGMAWSGRRKILLFSGRPLFIIEDEWQESFLVEIKPFEHYIPVKRDLSDLIEKLDWAEKNYAEALKIAERAQNFALSHLKRSDAIDEIARLMLEMSNNKIEK